MLASLMTLILWADAKKERDFAEKQQQIQMQTEGIQQLSKK